VGTERARRSWRAREPRLGLTRVFVYGTLMAGERNHALLGAARMLGPARTAPRYRLVDRGDHPGMVQGGTSAVAGELYAADAATVARLDAFESADDDYRRAAVTLADGRTAEAWLLDAERARGLPVIRAGSWRAWSARRGAR
jgi:gamma-glutamylcyclotransferase (GGCT)/AIG2-like uncharacterized protein YtfP